MKQRAWTLAGASLALLLAACGRGADTGATSNANAPGSPGADDRVVAQPAAPDGPPGGPSGVKGSLPHTGSSGGDVPPGATGTGVAGASSAPGTGLHGGLGDGSSTAAMGAGPVAAEGSPNLTPKDRVGSR